MSELKARTLFDITLSNGNILPAGSEGPIVKTIYDEDTVDLLVDFGGSIVLRIPAEDLEGVRR